MDKLKKKEPPKETDLGRRWEALWSTVKDKRVREEAMQLSHWYDRASQDRNKVYDAVTGMLRTYHEQRLMMDKARQGGEVEESRVTASVAQEERLAAGIYDEEGVVEQQVAGQGAAAE